MVATVRINEKNGAGETKTAKTSSAVRFKRVDNAKADLENQMTIPASGEQCSYEKVLRAEILVAPVTQIENLVVFTDGVNNLGIGVSVFYKVEGSYGQPVDLVDATTRAAQLVTTDLFTATSAAPIDMDGINTGPFSAVGDVGDYLVVGMQVDNSAVNSMAGLEGLSWSYDES